MITGAHFLLYSSDAEADRGFLREKFGFRAADAGDGWLIFGLPPAELAIHPGDGRFLQLHAGNHLLGSVLYLMCDSLEEETARLKAEGVMCSPPQEAEWGRGVTVPLPSGGRIGLYEPSHPSPLDD